AAWPRHHRRAAGQRLDHHEAEWLGPVDRKEQAQGLGEKFPLLVVTDLADILDEGAVDQRPHLALEVLAVVRVGFRGDPQRDPHFVRDSDRHLRALFPRKTAEEREITAATGPLGTWDLV